MLGQGAYGYVNKEDNMAVKKFSKLSHLIQEYTALQYLKEYNTIVHPVEVDYNKLLLKMELYDCSLRQWMQKECNCEDCINIILKDVLKGLITLQSLNLSHSDIKPGNILIQLNPLKAVLGDCGFVSIDKYSKQQRTARSYRDLVVVNDNKHDMFSFGILFLELVYKVKPYIKDNYSDYLKIINKKVTVSKHRKILRLLLSENRESRPSALEVLQILYSENFTININKVNKNSDKQQLYTKYTKHNIIKLQYAINKVSTALDIKRSKRGYEALASYMLTNNVKNLNYYVAATLFIMASLFSNKPADMVAIFKMCEITDRKLIISVLYQLTQDNTFTKILFY